MQATQFTSAGEESGKVTLDKTIFGTGLFEGLIHRLFIMQRANARNSIAHTKTRGERRGSTRKIYRQKGTGRARMGANRSPIRKKGGVAFGPRNNSNFTLSMNKKERTKALTSLLSQKAKAKKIHVVTGMNLEKTKDFTTLATSVHAGKSALYVVTADQPTVAQTASNVVDVKVILVNYLNPADLLKYDTVVFSEEALKSIGSIFNVA